MRAADHGLVILSAWRSYLLVEPCTVPLQRQFSKTVNIKKKTVKKYMK